MKNAENRNKNLEVNKPNNKIDLGAGSGSALRIKLNPSHNHRGIEKLYEKMHLNQGVFLSERVSAHLSVSSSLAYALAAEEVIGLSIPQRAEYIRTIASELERIRAHLYCIMLIGRLSRAERLRSVSGKKLIEILALFERLFGNRYHSALIRIGGVSRDIATAEGEMLKDFLGEILQASDRMRMIVETDPLLALSIKKKGSLTPEIIRNYGISGPAARASGIDIDIRRDEPYSAYPYLDFAVPRREEGDIFARMLIRIEEIFESVSMISDSLSALKRINTPLFAELDRMPEGEGIGRSESPEGEFFHYIRSWGGNVPFRHKIRPPSYMIAPAAEKVFGQSGIDNNQLILISLDPSYLYFSGLAAESGTSGYNLQIPNNPVPGFSASLKESGSSSAPVRN